MRVMTIIAAIVALTILVGLTVFQILLIVGAPLGKYAWGGQHKILPKKLRISSIVSILLYIIFAVFILSKSGLVVLIENDPILNIGMWVITAYFFLGIFMNAISKSKKERALMTPVAALLAVSFLIVALA